MSRLVVSVLGNRDSGKSHTWNNLFGHEVRTGTHARELQIAPGVCVTVFLVSGSPEERRTDIETILRGHTPDIILCSVQYLEGAQDTYQFFLDRDYDLVVHWLNPGYRDSEYKPDSLRLVEWLRRQRSLIGERDAHGNATARVDELRYIIHGWAAQHGLLHSCS
jgi:hypothetical protein